VTITINGLPLQFSLLHTLDILLYIVSSYYRRSKFIDFINNKNDFKCFDIGSCLFAGQFPDFLTFRLNNSRWVFSIGHLASVCSAVCIHTYIHTYIPTHIYIHIHTYIHTYLHTYLHTYIHIYIHTHTYTHTYTYLPTYLIHTYMYTLKCNVNNHSM
jgi:hypothetical protein